MSIHNKRLQWFIIGLLFLLLVPYPLFHGLDALVLRRYDDARRGVNAYEMLHNGNFLVTSYNGQPDMWGTKPPLLVWTQVAFMAVLGPGELAVRLPSAIAGLLTCLLILAFSWKYLKNPWFSLIWAAVLITFNGYVDFHATRTGDFDALLTLFMFLYAFFFFLFTETKHRRFLLLTAIFITLAVMTKAVAGLFFLPALVIWAIIRGALKDILHSKQTWIGLGIFILIVGGYYFSREMMNPGYLRAVSQNEIGGRYLQPIEGHEVQFFYYIDNFFDNRLQKWAVYLIPGMVAGFFLKDRTAKNLHLLGIILVVTHLLIITSAGTKLPWYDLPEFPFIALLISGFIWVIIAFIIQLYETYQKKILLLLPIVFTALIFYEPVRLTFKETNYIQERPWYLPDHEIAIFLREGVRGEKDLNGYILVNNEYDAQCLFYRNILKDNGQLVGKKKEDQLLSGDTVIVYQPGVIEYIENQYTEELLDSMQYVRVYAIR
jgi:4-amino-4-deoxy-L-arabinose transferase-like glycosyltransferase